MSRHDRIVRCHCYVVIARSLCGKLPGAHGCVDYSCFRSIRNDLLSGSSMQMFSLFVHNCVSAQLGIDSLCLLHTLVSCALLQPNPLIDGSPVCTDFCDDMRIVYTPPPVCHSDLALDAIKKQAHWSMCTSAMTLPLPTGVVSH